MAEIYIFNLISPTNNTPSTADNILNLAADNFGFNPNKPISFDLVDSSYISQSYGAKPAGISQSRSLNPSFLKIPVDFWQYALILKIEAYCVCVSAIWSLSLNKELKMTHSIPIPIITALILAVPVSQTVLAGGFLNFPSIQWLTEGAFPTRIPVEMPTPTTTAEFQK